MGRRTPNPRLVKIHRNYTVEEIALLFGAHKNTVRRWLQQGLQAIDGRRPTLVLGPELSRFLTERRNSRKVRCKPGEMYCLKCRRPRKPAGGLADYLPLTPSSGNLRGICPVCETLIHRRVSHAKIDATRGDLEISFRQAEPRIGEGDPPSLNGDSDQESRDHENP